jgi:dsDNA-specific endonuclease/ATPase MutS2
MKLTGLWRGLWRDKEIEPETEPPLGADEDPFDEPIVMEIRDVIDLHAIPPKQVKAVVEEYLLEARARRFPYVRIIHGKGIGAQRAMIRKILDRTSFIIHYYDAPPEAGGLGATIAELDLNECD